VSVGAKTTIVKKVKSVSDNENKSLQKHLPLVQNTQDMLNTFIIPKASLFKLPPYYGKHSNNFHLGATIHLLHYDFHLNK